MKTAGSVPTVKHGEESDPGVQMFGIGGKVSDVARREGRTLLCFGGAGGSLFRQGEDDVKVFSIEGFGLTILDRTGQINCQNRALWISQTIVPKPILKG